MNTRETKRTRDRLIRSSHPDSWRASEDEYGVKLMRDAAWTIQKLMEEIARLKAAKSGART